MKTEIYDDLSWCEYEYEMDDIDNPWLSGDDDDSDDEGDEIDRNL